ncbi:MAG TPA: hypothetical protein VF714_11180, partial [Jatrophihabitans sp.]
PQAFTHLSLINAVLHVIALERVEDAPGDNGSPLARPTANVNVGTTDGQAADGEAADGPTD